MTPFVTRLFGAFVALTLAAPAPAFSQPLELKLMAPAAPGGGWDQTARSMQQALVAAKIARSVQVTNVAGAGGYVFNTVQIGNSSQFGTNLWAFGGSTKSLEIVAPGLLTWNPDGTVTLGIGTFTLGDYNSFINGKPMQYTLTIVDPPGGPVSTPEPASLILLGLGGLSLGAFRRKAS